MANTESSDQTDDWVTVSGRVPSGALTGAIAVDTATTTTTTGAPITWTTTTGTLGGAKSAGVKVGPAKKPKAINPVEMPPKLGKKLIVAFLDDDDEAYWGKKLQAENIEIYMDEDGQSHMTLRLSMMDVYENDA